jgi:hypothetical protein
VLAGLDRTTPAVRVRVERLLARFSARDDTPLDIIDEGAALALWGADGTEEFLEWHVMAGGFARAVDVVLASIAFDRATYEWDNSIWALRAVRPGVGIGNLGLTPWLWLRERDDDRPAVRAVAAKARVHAVRCALAIVLPELWTPADEAELRQSDPDDHVAVEFGVAAALRSSKLKLSDIGRAWNRSEWVPADAIVRHLGSNAVAPLRLLRDYDALAKLYERGEADALRAIVEHADLAWDALTSIKPSARSIAAMVPLFTTNPPRRTMGLPLARAYFDEHVVAATAGSDDPFVARVLAETGASLPADAGWRSPWVSAKPARKPAATSAKSNAPAKPAAFVEQIHWANGEREELLQSPHEPDDDAAEAKKLLREAKTEKVFLLHIGWMRDVKLARATFTAIPPKSWYGQVDDVQMLVAKFGLETLDAILAFVQSKPDTLAGLANVESPRVAPVMARGFALVKKQQAVGKAWLARFPEAAAIGLVADLAAADQKQRDADEQALAWLAEQHAAIVEKHSGAKASELVATAAPALPTKPKKLPAFVDASRLPRPITSDGKHALQGAALIEFVQLLVTEHTAAIDAAVERYTEASLARFAFALFRQWLFVKGPPKDKWALHAVGRFGDDDAASALGKLARVWAPTGNPSRAQEAVETLAMMRSRTALAEIYDIAHKVQSKALNARAEQVFAALAEAAGMGAEDLADRLVPELGEDELVFGDARVEFDHMLVPKLAVAPEGDDLARWKKLEKLCKQVARTQLARLEDNMAAGHRMSFLHFAEVYLMHSLIRHLTSSLVWGAYRDGALEFAFAVDGNGQAIDLDGESLQLPSDASYGIVHPIELTASARAAWRERIGEQPFEQLARAVHSADDANDCERKLSTILQRTVPTAGLLALQRRGWRRGESPQGGCYYTIERDGAGWSAMVQFEPGIYLGAPTEQPIQSLQGLLVRGDAPKSALSELQRDMFTLLQ